MASDYSCEQHPSANVLLVDQEREVRDFLGEVVRSGCGCTTDSAATASGAVLKMSHQGFDLVLTDLTLPDADGKWLVRKIHQQQPRTGVIAISADSSAANIVDAVQAGADDFLPKPLDSQKVIERINHLLNKAKPVRRNAGWRRRTAGHLRRLRDRRQRLAQQVDLVCRDLVGGYRRTVEKLLDLQSQQECREAIDGELEMKPLLRNILRYLSNTFNGASGAVFLSPFGRAQARLFTAIGGGPPANIDDYDQALVAGIIQRTLDSRASVIDCYSYANGEAGAGSALSASDSGLCEDSPAVAVSPRSLLASGLYIRGRALGAVVLQRKHQEPFTPQEAALLNGLASSLARAIDLALRLASQNSP